jgi:hypothetical protein
VADFEDMVNPPVGPIAKMTDDEFTRFINHMLWLILDEVEELWSVLTPPSTPARTKPSRWPPQDIARLFRAWFDAGLLKLVRGEDGDYELPEDETRELLADTDRWQYAEPAQAVSFAATRHGQDEPDEVWLAVARTLRDT